jgi:hypothetical protein
VQSMNRTCLSVCHSEGNLLLRLDFSPSFCMPQIYNENALNKEAARKRITGETEKQENRESSPLRREADGAAVFRPLKDTLNPLRSSPLKSSANDPSIFESPPEYPERWP